MREHGFQRGAPTVRDIAFRLGLKQHPRSWRGNCPACDYPRVFSLREGKGGRPQAFCANGCNYDAIDEVLNRVTGGTWTPAERPDAESEAAARQRKSEAALRLWNSSEPAAGTPAGMYLTYRGLPGLAASAALRFRGDTWHPEGGRLPAMIALVEDVTGKPIAIHRTYLRCDGSGKANVEPPKASLGPIWGGAVRLDLAAGGYFPTTGSSQYHAGATLVIGEGIESSASAGRLLGLHAWAAISAGNLARGLVLPPDVRDVVIAADNDPADKHGNHPGQDAARSAWRRWTTEGRRVRIARPDLEGRDFNDLLRERLHARQ